jgi:hypothetical protein
MAGGAMSERGEWSVAEYTMDSGHCPIREFETGLFELRGHQVRIFYMFRPGRRIVLLDGIIKKQDAIPRDVVKRMRRYMHEVEAAEAAGG